MSQKGKFKIIILKTAVMPTTYGMYSVSQNRRAIQIWFWPGPRKMFMVMSYICLHACLRQQAGEKAPVDFQNKKEDVFSIPGGWGCRCEQVFSCFFFLFTPKFYFTLVHEQYAAVTQYLNYTVDLTKQNFALIFLKWPAVETRRGIGY